MFNYKFILEEVWSNNILLPKSSIIKWCYNGMCYPKGKTNRHGNYIYRLKPKIVKK